jgi:hypothetical protein
MLVLKTVKKSQIANNTRKRIFLKTAIAITILFGLNTTPYYLQMRKL